MGWGGPIQGADLGFISGSSFISSHLNLWLWCSWCATMCSLIGKAGAAASRPRLGEYSMEERKRLRFGS